MLHLKVFLKNDFCIESLFNLFTASETHIKEKHKINHAILRKKSEVTYKVIVTTGNKKNAGTDAKVTSKLLLHNYFIMFFTATVFQ